MQKCQDLAGSGEELFFRVLASLKWSVMTIECIDDKTPTPNWLLLSAAEGSSQVDIDIPSADVHLPSHPWNSSHVPPPHFFSIFPRLLLFFKHSSNNLNCSTLREQKQAPGSTDVFGCLSGTHLTLHQDLSGTEKSSQWPQAPVCRELLGFSRLRRNVWPCVPAKLQKLADLI